MKHEEKRRWRDREKERYGKEEIETQRKIDRTMVYKREKQRLEMRKREIDRKIDKMRKK